MQESNQIVSVFIITTFIIFLFLTFIYLLIYMNKKKQAQLKRDIQILTLNYEKSILTTQLEIQEQTFKNISQEIHDNISLSLTLAKLQLNILDFSKINELRTITENTIDLISKALNDLNDISKSLDSELIKSYGLIYALEAEKNLLNKSGAFQAEVNIIGEPRFFDATKELILFRIVQESCNNIIKHSKAKKINILLEYFDDEIILSIIDDGIGFDEKKVSNAKEKKVGSGLNNIRSRAKMIYAQAEILSSLNTGTVVKIILPHRKHDIPHAIKN